MCVHDVQASGAGLLAAAGGQHTPHAVVAGRPHGRVAWTDTCGLDGTTPGVRVRCGTTALWAHETMGPGGTP